MSSSILSALEALDTHAGGTLGDAARGNPYDAAREWCPADHQKVSDRHVEQGTSSAGMGLTQRGELPLAVVLQEHE